MNKEREDELLLDHDYDGIKELDNRLPPWWLYMFYFTIIWGVLYFIHYHVLGTGDSSYEEYMKEIDPDWKPRAEQSILAIGYRSPLSSTDRDLTPYLREQLQREAEEAARFEAAKKAETGTPGIPAGDMDFEALIMAAMRVSEPADMEKLRSAFPSIYEQYKASSGENVNEEAEQDAQEPEPQLEPLRDEASLASGQTVFVQNCATCHGQNGEGGIGPNLTDNYFIHGAGMNNTVEVIKNGVAAKGMIAWRGILNEQQIMEVASYVISLQGSSPPNAKAPQGEQVDLIR